MTAHPEPATRSTHGGVLRRLRRKFRSPGDVALALHMGWFLLTLPRRMARTPLPDLLARIERSPRPYACGLDRVVRLRNPWLYRVFPSRNTCYMRALCVYRFLTPDPGSELRIHFGVEPGTDPTDRLRGHAWVTLDAMLLEPPEPVVAGRVREIYVYPPA